MPFRRNTKTEAVGLPETGLRSAMLALQMRDQLCLTRDLMSFFGLLWRCED
jgi:hypothetical protein